MQEEMSQEIILARLLLNYVKYFQMHVMCVLKLRATSILMAKIHQRD